MYMMVPDITIYTNLWLSLATFASLQPNYSNMAGMKQDFKTISQDMVKLFNKNPRWTATELNLQEAANISVAIAILKLGNERFIGDVGDIIRMNINEQA